MRELTQTILLGDPSGLPGNCLQTAVACVLDLDLEEVPHFAVYKDWALRLQVFGRERGYRVRYMPPRGAVGLGLAFGPSLRGTTHAVVWAGGRMAWDPHPSRVGLLAVTELVAFELAPSASTATS